MSGLWPAVRRGLARVRQGLTSAARVPDWHDDLVGERRLREVERRPLEIAAAIRDVDDEIRAIMRERDSHD